MTLTVKLDNQTRDHLEYLKVLMNVENQSDAVRKLINDRFTQLQVDKTLVERRGGHPKHLMHGGANLSVRASRKAAVTEYIIAKMGSRRTK